MKSLTIALTPAGNFLLTFPGDTQSHSVIIPCSEKGARLLATTIRDWTSAARIATPAAPTQAMISEILKGESWGQILQLAGSARRRADIRAATGIIVRNRRKPARPREPTTAELHAMLQELGL